jgi:hypothetical protein
MNSRERVERTLNHQSVDPYENIDAMFDEWQKPLDECLREEWRNGPEH